MNQIYLDLVMSAIFEQFHTEQDFYQDYLGVNEVQWQQWKAGCYFILFKKIGRP